MEARPLLLLLVFLSFAAAFGLWFVVADPVTEGSSLGAAPEPPGGGLDQAAVDALTSELASLRAAIERLERTMRARDSMPAERIRGSQVEPSIDATRGPEGGVRSPLPPGAKELVGKPDPERRKGLAEIRAIPEEQRHRVHMFSTMADILEKYGLPDGASSDAGVITLSYQEGESAYNFKVADGIVVGLISWVR